MKLHEGTLHLSPTDLAGHLSCQHLTQLQRAVANGDMASPVCKDPRLEAMRERGWRHEDAYVERLRAGGREIHDLRGNLDPAATLAAMQAGAGAIVQAPLQHGRFRGTADVLLRVEAASALWAWSYEPVDTKLGRETKAGTILQLCTYADMLRHLQGSLPERVWVITPQADEPYRTADYAAYFRFVQRRLQNAATTANPDTYPDPVPHCDVCSFWAHCDTRRRADDHPSLVASIHSLHIGELQRQQIPTLTALAHTGGALPEQPERGRPETYQRLASQAALQVQARTLPLPPYATLPPEPGRGLARLPAPDPGDVFLDFEGDPFAGPGDGGLEYLTGWGWWDDAHRWHHQPAWATDRPGERDATIAFLHFVHDRLARHPGLHVYHYGAYEPAALKRVTARHGVGADLLDQLLRGQRFVDLHQVVREGLRIGVERYGLKELEPLHGFTRAFDLRDAALARRDVEIALELGNLGDLTMELRQQVTDYNREDCLSTSRLRDWLEERRAVLCAAGADLPRPVVVSGEPTEEVGKRDQGLQAAAERLRQGLPADPAQRTEDQHARELLAQMLGYFRREEKCGWWEHFRLRDLDDHDLLDEREALSGLQFVEEVQQFGVHGQPKLPLHRYRFPPQESSLAVGKKIRLPLSQGDHKNTVGQITAIDAVVGALEFQTTKVSRHLRLTALFKDQLVGADAPEASLLAFADHVASHGFPESGPFAAAADLLRRRLPRRTGGVGGPLRQENEDLGAATLRLCRELDHGVLPIQGPPGSGKSHTGAQTIISLLRDDKRVGITAVSHKVVDNLLEKVAELAGKDGVAVRLVHCDRNGGDGRGIDYLERKVGIEDRVAVLGGDRRVFRMAVGAGCLRIEKGLRQPEVQDVGAPVGRVEEGVAVALHPRVRVPLEAAEVVPVDEARVRDARPRRTSNTRAAHSSARASAGDRAPRTRSTGTRSFLPPRPHAAPSRAHRVPGLACSCHGGCAPTFTEPLENLGDAMFVCLVVHCLPREAGEPRRQDLGPVDADLPRTRLVREEHDIDLAQVDLPQQIEEDAEGRAGLGLTPTALRQENASIHQPGALGDPRTGAVGLLRAVPRVHVEALEVVAAPARPSERFRLRQDASRRRRRVWSQLLRTDVPFREPRQLRLGQEIDRLVQHVVDALLAQLAQHSAQFRAIDLGPGHGTWRPRTLATSGEPTYPSAMADDNDLAGPTTRQCYNSIAAVRVRSQERQDPQPAAALPHRPGSEWIEAHRRWLGAN